MGDDVTAMEATLEAADTRRRRRPLFYVVCIGLMCLGAVVAAWAFTTASHSQKVLAVASTVHRGEVISQSDLTTVSISVDPSLQPVGAAAASDVVGKVAALDLSAGSIVTSQSVAASLVPARGQSVVGLSLSAAQMPAQTLYSGDSVTLVAVGNDGANGFSQDNATIDGSVVGVSADPESGSTVVNVAVPSSLAAGLAAKAAVGHVALVLDSREQ